MESQLKAFESWVELPSSHIEASTEKAQHLVNNYRRLQAIIRDTVTNKVPANEFLEAKAPDIPVGNMTNVTPSQLYSQQQQLPIQQQGMYPDANQAYQVQQDSAAMGFKGGNMSQASYNLQHQASPYQQQYGQQYNQLQPPMGRPGQEELLTLQQSPYGMQQPPQEPKMNPYGL